MQLHDSYKTHTLQPQLFDVSLKYGLNEFYERDIWFTALLELKYYAKILALLEYQFWHQSEIKYKIAYQIIFVQFFIPNITFI